MSVSRVVAPFNGALETGLRALVLLDELFPDAASLERLVIFDYLVVHSGDLPDGPPSLHPAVPNRSGELLVRRQSLQDGLWLFESKGLMLRSFTSSGIRYAASEQSGWFLDAIDAEYVSLLRMRARWLVERLGSLRDNELKDLVDRHLGQWGAEFAMQSVLWAEEGE